MAKLTLLTYATPEFAAQQRALCDSATASGFDAVVALSPANLAGTAFWQQNRATLEQKRGGGYWLWKPYIILEQVRRLAPGEVLLYCDAGRDASNRFTRRPERLMAQAQSVEGGFVCGTKTPQFGPLIRWTKRDCLILMGADTPEFWTRPQIQATWSVWTNTPAAIDFLEQWLEYATDPRCLTDLPSALNEEHPEFLDHRHDQSIATLLAYRRNAPFLDLEATGLYRLFALRPRSRLANTYLKRPQHADDLLAGRPAWLSLILAQLRYAG